MTTHSGWSFCWDLHRGCPEDEFRFPESRFSQGSMCDFVTKDLARHSKSTNPMLSVLGIIRRKNYLREPQCKTQRRFWPYWWRLERPRQSQWVLRKHGATGTLAYTMTTSLVTPAAVSSHHHPLFTSILLRIGSRSFDAMSIDTARFWCVHRLLRQQT
jgi:hypothetical protein